MTNERFLELTKGLADEADATVVAAYNKGSGSTVMVDGKGLTCACLILALMHHMAEQTNSTFDELADFLMTMEKDAARFNMYRESKKENLQ